MGEIKCLQRCGNLAEEDHDYCEYCCDNENPHPFCKLHGEGTETWKEYLVQMEVYEAKENPWLKPDSRDMNNITNEIELWLKQYKRNIINKNNGLDVTKYEEYNYEEARMIFENILKEESK